MQRWLYFITPYKLHTICKRSFSASYSNLCWSSKIVTHISHIITSSFKIKWWNQKITVNGIYSSAKFTRYSCMQRIEAVLKLYTEIYANIIKIRCTIRIESQFDWKYQWMLNGERNSKQTAVLAASTTTGEREGGGRVAHIHGFYRSNNNIGPKILKNNHHGNSNNKKW